MAIVAAAGGWTQAAAGQEASSADAMALRGNAAIELDPEKPDDAGEPLPLVTIGPMRADKPAGLLATETRAGNEAKPLGLPGGKSPAPAENATMDDQAGASGGGVLSALDPRRNDVSRVVLALGAVIGLMLLCRQMIKRSGAVMGAGERPSGVLEIMARYPVARGQHLVLIKLARRIILVHHSGGAMRTLSEISDGDEVASLLARMEAGANAKAAAKFRAALGEFQAEHDRVAAAPAPSPAPATAAARLGPIGNRPATRAASPAALQPEIVDLTRSQGRGLGALLGKRAPR
jgi:flagellar biogenesis protein FliO